MFKRSAIALALCLQMPMLSLSPEAIAHPPAILNQAGEKAIAEEITAFRKEL